MDTCPMCGTKTITEEPYDANGNYLDALVRTFCPDCMWESD